MTFINSNYSADYLAGIKETFQRMDSVENGGNGDNKVSVKEALRDLNIDSLLSGQNEEDTAKIEAAASNITNVLTQYAGEDGEFSEEEWADFINGKEWGAVLDAWHASGQMAQLEMNWTDNAHIQDQRVTKGEVKVGIKNNLINNNYSDVDTTDIEALIDKYAGEDGTFSYKEYREMKKDSVYKEFVDKYHVVPWFNSNTDKVKNNIKKSAKQFGL